VGAVRTVQLGDVDPIELPQGSWSRMLVTAGRVEGNASSLGYSVFTPGTVLAPVRHETEEVAYVVSRSGVPRLDDGAVPFAEGEQDIRVPVYEENAIDDDLLNEGKRNLLDYLQSRGYFDAKVVIQKESDPDKVRVTYTIDPGPVHRVRLIEITGNKYFSRQLIRQRLQIQPAVRFFYHGRYSGVLLKNDVANLQSMYASN